MIVRRLLAREMPALPRIGWNVVDVRDVAALHLFAMTSPAAGQRYLASGTYHRKSRSTPSWRWCVPNSAASGSSTAARHARSAGEPRPTEQTIVDTATALIGTSRLGGGAGQA